MFVDVEKSMGVGGGKKLQSYPTNLTYSTPVMWWKGWGGLLKKLNEHKPMEYSEGTGLHHRYQRIAA
jgi:hypothetical protein